MYVTARFRKLCMGIEKDRSTSIALKLANADVMGSAVCPHEIYILMKANLSLLNRNLTVAQQ